MSRGSGGSPYEVKQRRKQALLATLSKLEDRDTQATASTELLEALRSLDGESLPNFVSCLTNSLEKQKVYSRRECVNLLGVLASEVCPVYQLALQQPLVGKVLSAIRTKFKDTDTSVRDAASTSIAVVANGLALQSERELDHEHPLVKSLLDSLKEPNSKEVQGAAADSLRKSISSLKVSQSLTKTLVKTVNGKNYPAAGPLLSVLAGVDEKNCVQGAVKVAPEAVVPVAASLVGSPAGAGQAATGMFIHMQNKEWVVRRCACEALYALAVQLGPAMDASAVATLDAYDATRTTCRAIQALETVKFDRVEHVRKRAASALTVLTEIQDAIASGQAEGWSWSEDRDMMDLAAKRETKNPSGLVSGAVKERFMKKSGQDADVIVNAQVADPRSRPSTAPPGRKAAGSQASEEAIAESVGRQLNISVTQSVDSRLPARRPVEPHSPEVVIKTKPRPIGALPETSNRASSEISAHPIQVRNLDTPHEPQRDFGNMNSRAKGTPAAAAEGMVMVPEKEWMLVLNRLAALEASQARLAALEDQQGRMLSMVENFAMNTQNAFVAVETRVASLERVVDEGMGSAGWAPEDVSKEQEEASEDASFYNATFAPEMLAGEKGESEGLAEEQLEGSHLDTSYRSAIRNCEPPDVAALMLKTGPQWKLLSHATSVALLNFIQEAVKTDPAQTLAAVLPWLWQLADDDFVPLQVPRSMAQDIVHVLKHIAPETATAVGSNLGILISTLEWTWGLSAAQPSPVKAAAPEAHRPSPVVSIPAPNPTPQMPQSPSAARPGLPPMSPSMTGQSGLVRTLSGNQRSVSGESPGSRHRRRPSLEGIGAMQEQLSKMQNELMLSPRHRG